MSSKLFLGSVALLTGAVIYEKNKAPTAVTTPENLEKWQQANSYKTKSDSNSKSKLDEFAKNVDSHQYDGRQNLLTSDRRGSLGLDHFYNNAKTDDGNLQNIKTGLKEDVSSLKNAILHNHQNPPVSNYVRKDESKPFKSTLKENGESLTKAVFKDIDDFKMAGESMKNNLTKKNSFNSDNDEYGNKAVLQQQLHNAEDEVSVLKRQLRSLDGSGNYTFEEKQAIDNNKNVMSGFGENAAFFANEQYENVHGSPKDRFNTKTSFPALYDKTGRRITAKEEQMLENNSFMAGFGENASFFANEQYESAHGSPKYRFNAGNSFPLVFDQNGKRLSEQDLLKIQRNGLRGWGENAGWFADEQYRSGKEEDQKMGKMGSIVDGVKDMTIEKTNDINDKFSKLNNSVKDTVAEKKDDFNEARDEWKKWGTTKINESEDKLKDISTDAKDASKSWWDWSKNQADEKMSEGKNKAIDVADDTLKKTSKGFTKASESLEEQRDFINDRKN
ncbi:hypothetical protein QEN19_004348 [Hanseniaspora menglaensis]